MFRKILLLLILLLACLFLGCQSGTAGDPHTKLAFYNSDFHKEEDFTFDSLMLTDSYKNFEKRMELSDLEPVISEREAMSGDMVTVTYYHVELEDMPEVYGDIEYSFFDGGFASGRMTLIFADYAQAEDFVLEHMEQLAPLQSETAREEMEEAGAAYHGYSMYESIGETSISACYVDERNVCITLRLDPVMDGAGEVKIFYGENLDYNRPGAKEESQYFEFEVRE